MGIDFQTGERKSLPVALPDSTSGANAISAQAPRILSIEEYQAAYDTFFKFRIEQASDLAKQDMHNWLVAQGYMPQGQKLGSGRDLTAACEPVSESEAKRVFVLMNSLEGGRKSRKAALNKVFRLLVMNGYTQEDVARECKCAPSLITLRVVEIEKKMGRPVSSLRLLATRLGEMNKTIEKDPRARTLYRKRLVDDTGAEFEE